MIDFKHEVQIRYFWSFNKILLTIMTKKLDMDQVKKCLFWVDFKTKDFIYYFQSTDKLKSIFISFVL